MTYITVITESPSMRVLRVEDVDPAERSRFGVAPLPNNLFIVVEKMVRSQLEREPHWVTVYTFGKPDTHIPMIKELLTSLLAGAVSGKRYVRFENGERINEIQHSAGVTVHPLDKEK